jgi:hypothetical protein
MRVREHVCMCVGGWFGGLGRGRGRGSEMSVNHPSK